MILHTNTTELTPMKVIDMSTKSSAKAYLSRDPSDTHSKEELEAVHRAIRYTQICKQQESLSKMDEEEQLVRPISLR